MHQKLKFRADLVLVLITIIWGTTFTVTKIGIDQIPPLFYLSLRFLIAFLLLAVLFRKSLKTINKQTLIAGAMLGLFLTLGFVTQTMGLQYTTASKAAFITGLSVILTPLLTIFVARKKTSVFTWLGAVVAFSGLAVLSVEPGTSTLLSWGDFLVLLCAIAFAFHIVTMGKYAPEYDITVLATLQVGVTALSTGFFALYLEEFPKVVTGDIWFGIFYMGIVATALVLLMQTWAQKYTSPTRTAIIFALEPVFAAIVAFIILYEAITAKTIIGGLLILGGILLTELKSEKKEIEANG